MTSKQIYYGTLPWYFLLATGIFALLMLAFVIAWLIHPESMKHSAYYRFGLLGLACLFLYRKTRIEINAQRIEFKQFSLIPYSVLFSVRDLRAITTHKNCVSLSIQDPSDDQEKTLSYRGSTADCAELVRRLQHYVTPTTK